MLFASAPLHSPRPSEPPARHVLVAKLEKPLAVYDGGGFRFDWVIDDILMREMALLIDEANGSSR